MIKVYTAGTWDMFHVGHLNIFKKSKELGTHLIVGVSTDELVYSYKKHYPIIPFENRIELIKSCKYVDEVVPQTKLLDPEDLKHICPNVFTIGTDWKGKELPGIKFLRKIGTKIVYFNYTEEISSSIIRERLAAIYKG